LRDTAAICEENTIRIGEHDASLFPLVPLCLSSRLNPFSKESGVRDCSIVSSPICRIDLLRMRRKKRAQSRSSRRGAARCVFVSPENLNRRSFFAVARLDSFDSCSPLRPHSLAANVGNQCVSQDRVMGSAPEATPSREECRSRRRVGLQNISVCAFASPRAFHPARIRIAITAASSMREERSRLAKSPPPPPPSPRRPPCGIPRARRFPESAPGRRNPCETHGAPSTCSVPNPRSRVACRGCTSATPFSLVRMREIRASKIIEVMFHVQINFLLSKFHSPDSRPRMKTERFRGPAKSSID